MQTKNAKTRPARGFTIIEVMIVLAIAALILLIVFLAVPAFQRNQRNTARKGDVGRIGSAVVTFVSNNNNNLPNSLANDQAILSSLGTLGHYTFALPTIFTWSFPGNNRLTIQSGARPILNPALVNAVNIVTNAQCSTTTVGATDLGITSRQMAIQYVLETSDPANGLPQCYNIQ